MDELSEDALKTILTEPKNALIKQYEKLFEMENVQLRFEEDALKAVVEKASQRGTGARALRTVLEDIMLDLMYDLPSRKEVDQVTITREVIDDGEVPLTTKRKRQKRA